jgi:SAM-dependent methyltransferase
MAKNINGKQKRRAYLDSQLNLPANDFVRNWYMNEYSSNSYSGGAGLVQKLMHGSLELGYSTSTSFDNVLELGGNVGEHLPFVKHSFKTYLLTDVVENIDGNSIRELEEKGVKFQTENVQSLTFEESAFDRVLSTCLLHHVADPETALLEIRRVLKSQGVADIFLSADPGLLFRFARWMGPRHQARMKGIDELKSLMDARDHINHAGGLRRLIKHVFRSDSLVERTYPIRGMTWNSSLWHTFRIIKK